MTLEQIFLDAAVAIVAIAVVIAALEPLLWRRYELVVDRGLRFARRSRRRAARRAAGYVLMAADELGRRRLGERAAEANGHHDPGNYPELEALVEAEMRREAREG